MTYARSPSLGRFTAFCSGPRAVICRAVAVLIAACAIPPVLVADEVSAEKARRTPTATEVEDAIPEGGSLTGREIYDRFLQNKFKQSFQRLRVTSFDPGGSQQETSFEMSLQNTRDERDEAVDGILAKMLIQVTAPFDMRHTRYLIISKDPGPDDEFIYQPSTRKVQRVDLKSTSLMGTDYTFNDVAFQDIEDADYIRMPDEIIDGTSVYVVEANVKETVDVEYHRTVSYLHKEHYVPLRVRYWDDYGVEVKELSAPAKEIRQFDDVWVATESMMRDLMQRTHSKMFVDEVETKPTFHRKIFTIAQLMKGK